MTIILSTLTSRIIGSSSKILCYRIHLHRERLLAYAGLSMAKVPAYGSGVRTSSRLHLTPDLGRLDTYPSATNRNENQLHKT
ncbi:Uncharacterized protein HZ326_26239 [Fusarium oxysporum f. sp. albedinis]|nr:Uncharacterized protein HZ326_26239 [Fusarium oxysporum f. sp. albedinis]